MLKEFREIED